MSKRSYAQTHACPPCMMGPPPKRRSSRIILQNTGDSFPEDYLDQFINCVDVFQNQLFNKDFFADTRLQAIFEADKYKIGAFVCACKLGNFSPYWIKYRFIQLMKYLWIEKEKSKEKERIDQTITSHCCYCNHFHGPLYDINSMGEARLYGEIESDDPSVRSSPADPNDHFTLAMIAHITLKIAPCL